MMTGMDFFRPKNLSETLKILDQPGKKSLIIAGGTDIIPGLHQASERFCQARRLIAIDHLHELNTMIKRKTYIEIGAAVNFTRLAADPVVRQHLPLLSDAASRVGSVQIRNRATIAGNFINNAPCADSLPPLLVYEARIRIRSVNGAYELPLSEILSGPYRTKLKSNELVTSVKVPVTGDGWTGAFYKLGRRRSIAVSRISLAVLLKKRNDHIDACRIACGAVTPVAVRLHNIENECTGQRPTPAFLKMLARSLGNEILSITGLRWSTSYKLPVIQQVFYQLLTELAERRV